MVLSIPHRHDGIQAHRTQGVPVAEHVQDSLRGSDARIAGRNVVRRERAMQPYDSDVCERTRERRVDPIGWLKDRRRVQRSELTNERMGALRQGPKRRKERVQFLLRKICNQKGGRREKKTKDQNGPLHLEWRTKCVRTRFPLARQEMGAFE
jgi:hypothetical protein